MSTNELEMPKQPDAEAKEASLEISEPESEAKPSDEQVEQFAEGAETEFRREAEGIVPQARKQVESAAASMHILPGTVEGLDTQLAEVQAEAGELVADAENEIDTTVRENDVLRVQQETGKIEKNNTVKKGVDFVFEQYSELAQIGTASEYSEYLDTIFPQSKIKDIVYHGLPYIENKNDYFRDGGEDIRTWNFFYKNRERALSVGDSTYCVVINSSADYYSGEVEYKGSPTCKTHDSAIVIEQGGDEFVVKSKTQIYILGSEKDILGFKQFVENKT
jgi:hypothetical protein